MSITVTERYNSNSLDRMETGAGSNGKVLYIVECTGADIDAAVTAVRTAVQAVAPATYGSGLVLRTINCEEMHRGFWYVTASYSDSKGSIKPATDTTVVTFNNRAVTQHITQSKEMIAVYGPATVTVPDYKGAIGVTGDGVEGTDIYVPQPTVSVTLYKTKSYVASTYQPLVESLTGKVNNASFSIAGMAYAAGELLFLGGTSTFRGAGSDDLVEVQLEFAVSRNATGLTIGDITGIDKNGWEYLWVKYDDVEHTASHTVNKIPRFAVRERVYDLASFSGLA